MAAPGGVAAGAFAAWLAARLEALGLDRAVYGAYIEGLLREEESDEERLEALRGVLAACLVSDGAARLAGWAGRASRGEGPLPAAVGARSAPLSFPAPRRSSLAGLGGSGVGLAQGTGGHRPAEAPGSVTALHGGPRHPAAVLGPAGEGVCGGRCAAVGAGEERAVSCVRGRRAVAPWSGPGGVTGPSEAQRQRWPLSPQLQHGGLCPQPGPWVRPALGQPCAGRGRRCRGGHGSAPPPAARERVRAERREELLFDNRLLRDFYTIRVSGCCTNGWLVV